MDFLRQTRIFNPENQKSNILVIGAGSTGSFITLTLAKLGFNKIKIIDFDKIEAHNIPNQFYRTQDIGKLKVNALKEIVKEFTDLEIETENVKIDDSYEFDLDLNTIVIFCLDSMEARKLIYEKIKDMPIRLVDTRMGGEGYQIYSIDLNEDEEKAKYERTLNASTMDTVCGEKSVIYCILSIASETCNIIKKIDKSEACPRILKRELKTYKFLGG